MAFRNQNLHPWKNPGVDDIPLHNTRKSMGQTSTRPTRHPFSVVSCNIHDDLSPAADISSTKAAVIEFSKEEVEALLSEKPRAKKFDIKSKMEQLIEHNKRLKLCVKWFQRVDQKHAHEKETLQSTLQSIEKKCSDSEMEMINREKILNATILQLLKEKEATVAAENLQASLSEKLEKAEQEVAAVNKKAASLEDMYNSLQEYNLRLQDYNTTLQADLIKVDDSLKRVEKEKMTILESLLTLRGHHRSLQASQDEAVEQNKLLLDEVKCLKEQLQKLNAESNCKCFTQIDLCITQLEFLEDKCSSYEEQIKILELQLATADEKIKMTDLSASETHAEFEGKNRYIRELQDCLTDAEREVADGEKFREKPHTTISELKGNIRVFCRVRPLLPDDGAGTDASVISYPTTGETVGRGVDLLQSGLKHRFTFDKVLSHEASQQDVFAEISQLVQSALDGYKVCIFSYGQTGSGKTYTMMGRPEAPEEKGLIPRSLEQIFQASQSLLAHGWKYKIKASILEIYNETIRDLLSPNRSSGSYSSWTENGVPGNKYQIKHDADGNTHVSDLTIVDVCSIAEISSLLHQAEQSRSIGKTEKNKQSSRSHLVFTLRISGVNESTSRHVHGVLNLIDLAGSERLSRSGATGGRLKETQAINSSLSSLSDVICSMAKKEEYVPFKNSKLTHLLQPCLGGDSKTLVVVNISPDPSTISESFCSLEFAARVNSCEIGVEGERLRKNAMKEESTKAKRVKKRKYSCPDIIGGRLVEFNDGGGDASTSKRPRCRSIRLKHCISLDDYILDTDRVSF